MTELSQAEAAILTARHVAAFNAGVMTGDFTDFLGLFADDAVIRFENVPRLGQLQFDGRDAYTQAYANQPPDDKIDITATAQCQGDQVIVPFAWRQDGATGTIHLSFTSAPADHLDDRLVTAMIVTFD
jgi:SnoaL-like domain